MATEHSILVIRLSAFGDIIRSLGCMAAIRQHHPHARISWLTSKPYAALTDHSGYFDEVIIAPRGQWWRIVRWFGFIRRLRKFDVVYDLQRNDRTRLMRMFRRRGQQWLVDAVPPTHLLDTRDLLAFPLPDARWMEGDITHFAIPAPYALLVPGCAPQHPHKRWPYFAELAQRLAAQGITPVALGTAAEQDVIARMSEAVPTLVDLAGRTSMGDIAALARGAAGAIGNDTGPMHVIALAGCPLVSLFSDQTDPARSAPLGGQVSVLQSAPISALSVDTVWNAFTDRARS